MIQEGRVTMQDGDFHTGDLEVDLEKRIVRFYVWGYETIVPFENIKHIKFKAK